MSTGNEGQNVAIARLLTRIRTDLRSVITVSQSCSELAAAVTLLRVADKAILEARRIISRASAQDSPVDVLVAHADNPGGLAKEQIAFLDDALREWQELADNWSELDLESKPVDNVYGPSDGPAPGRTKHSFWAHVRRLCGDEFDEEEWRQMEEREVDRRLGEGGMGAVYDDLDEMCCHFAWEADYVERLDALLTALSEGDETAQESGSHLIAEVIKALNDAKHGKIDGRDWSLRVSED
jgi:hypothetical protein